LITAKRQAMRQALEQAVEAQRQREEGAAQLTAQEQILDKKRSQLAIQAQPAAGKGKSKEPRLSAVGAARNGGRS
jgi:hypothetical protein